MMIDWLTLVIDLTAMDPDEYLKLSAQFGRIIKVAPGGEVEWEMAARESIRSDSHQVQVTVGAAIRIQGSPARVMGDHNVFGSDDIGACARAMINHAAQALGVRFPGYRRWKCSRVDVTCNYDLGSLTAVREALMALRHAEGGRYQLRTEAESVYWSVRSRRRSGKGYAKGPHLRYLQKKGLVELSEDELDLADRLLRLEMKLGSQFWSESEKNGFRWFDYTAADLMRLHYEYFAPLVGSAEVTEMTDMESKLYKAAESLGYRPGDGKGAFRHYCLVMTIGHDQAKASCQKSAYYRYRKIMLTAGISWADIQAKKILPFRRKPILLGEPVRSFDEMRRSA